jgi:hypothetical protein
MSKGASFSSGDRYDRLTSATASASARMPIFPAAIRVFERDYAPIPQLVKLSRTSVVDELNVSRQAKQAPSTFSPCDSEGIADQDKKVPVLLDSRRAEVVGYETAGEQF